MRTCFISLLLWLSTAQAAPQWTWVVKDSLAHPQHRFTQGLQWYGGELYESTGLVGKSTLYRMNAKGQVLDSVSLSAPHFGEGIAVRENEIQWLTWQSGIQFTYARKTLEPIYQSPLLGEGWGLTFADNEFWQSNGSSEILRLNTDSRLPQGKIQVKEGSRPIQQLNELETVGIYLLANVWQTDSIAIIERKTGSVKGWLNLQPLCQHIRKKYPKADVLNGIAWDGKNLWITGKLWPKYYVLKVDKLM